MVFDSISLRLLGPSRQEPRPIKKGVPPFHIDRKDCHLTLDAVPAWICRQCGEVYFDETVVNSIQDIIRAWKDLIKNLAVAA